MTSIVSGKQKCPKAELRGRRKQLDEQQDRQPATFSGVLTIHMLASDSAHWPRNLVVSSP